MNKIQQQILDHSNLLRHNLAQQGFHPTLIKYIVSASEAAALAVANSWDDIYQDQLADAKPR